MDGEIMVDDNGERRVNKDTTKVAIHFFRLDQFLGFFGSLALSQVTLQLVNSA